MKKWILGLFVFSVFSVFSVQAAVVPSYVFEKKEQAEQFKALTEELRCLVCQNETIADSRAPLANDLRAQIAEKIRAGKTKKEIHHYLLARYGDFILYRPPLRKGTYLLWWGPGFALLLGLGILFRSLKKCNAL